MCFLHLIEQIEPQSCYSKKLGIQIMNYWLVFFSNVDGGKGPLSENDYKEV